MRFTCLFVLLLALAAACVKEPQVRIEGDKLYLPPESSVLAQKRLASPDQLPFLRFDGQYPERWPAVFSLPAECYLLDSPSLNYAPGIGGAEEPALRISGVCRRTTQDVLAAWKRQLAASGWQDDLVQDLPGTPMGAFYSPGLHYHSVWDWSDHSYREIRGIRSMNPETYQDEIRGYMAHRDVFALFIYDHAGMGGWTYFELWHRQEYQGLSPVEAQRRLKLQEQDGGTPSGA